MIAVSGQNRSRAVQRGFGWRGVSYDPMGGKAMPCGSRGGEVAERLLREFIAVVSANSQGCYTC